MLAFRRRFRPVSGQVGSLDTADAPRAALCYRGAMPATPAWPPASTPRLYIDQPLGPDAAPHIDGAAAHYLLNVMRLHSPQSAILSAVIFNALVIIALIPLSLRGVRYTPSSASKLLSRNLYVYGLGGIVAPFIGIKLIDLLIQFIPGMS